MTIAALPPVPVTQFSVDTTNIKDQGTTAALTALARQVHAEFAKVTYSSRAQPSALLSSPSGYVFAVAVDDKGNVTAARVRGG